MTQFAYRAGDTWVEIIGAWASMLGDHAPGWVDAASPAERQASGAVAIEDGQLRPHAHQTKVGEELVDVGGVPTRRGVFVDLTIDERKAEMTAMLRTSWLVHELSGFDGPGGRVPTDETTQRRLLVALAFPSDYAVPWEARPGEMVLVSAAQIAALSGAIFGHVAVCAAQAYGLQTKIKAAKTHAELSAVDLNAGWPA